MVDKIRDKRLFHNRHGSPSIQQAGQSIITEGEMIEGSVALLA